MLRVVPGHQALARCDPVPGGAEGCQPVLRQGALALRDSCLHQHPAAQLGQGLPGSLLPMLGRLTPACRWASSLLKTRRGVLGSRQAGGGVVCAVGTRVPSLPLLLFAKLVCAEQAPSDLE